MSARRIDGVWWVDFRYERERIRKKSPVNNKRGAEEYEQKLRQELLSGSLGKRKEVPTFDEWFLGRFWREWVVGRKNKPSETEAKESIYRVHLKAAFGHLPIDQIGVAQVASFRASLVERQPPLSEKRINNILAVLSKPLRYAVDVEVIVRAPKVGLFKVERPEIECWEMQEYARLLHAAQEFGSEWYAAVCLAGEAGLRVGEVKELRWHEDVDLIAETITVNRQIRRGIVGTPKGRTRRTIPMTRTLLTALGQLRRSRSGLVIADGNGHHQGDNQADRALGSICKRAGLSDRRWHTLRHSFGTHAALLGVNPWRLMSWMGHKRIDETMRYVHVAESHRRLLPEEVLREGAGESDPDRRILMMLGARGQLMGSNSVGQGSDRR